ncbi:unnamed protein product [Camellia sinensis]
MVEYAIEAIKLGSTAIGLKTKEGVVLAVEKRITSPLLEPSSVEKIMEIDEHIGCAMSGEVKELHFAGRRRNPELLEEEFGFSAAFLERFLHFSFTGVTMISSGMKIYESRFALFFSVLAAFSDRLQHVNRD